MLHPKLFGASSAEMETSKEEKIFQPSYQQWKHSNPTMNQARSETLTGYIIYINDLFER